MTTAAIATRTPSINAALKASGAEFTVEARQICKDNGKKIGLVLHSSTSTTAPTVYPDSRFKTMSDADVAEALMKIYTDKKTDISLDNVIEHDYILEHVKPRLVNLKKNEKNFLEDGRLCREFLDLLVAYDVTLPDSEDGEEATIPVTDNLLSNAGLSGKEVIDTAKKNAGKDATIMPIGDVLGMAHMDDEVPLLVVTSASKINGAGVILSDVVLDSLHDKLGKKFYILPSSVHEVLATSSALDPVDLLDLVKQVNRTEVGLNSEEFLADNVYICGGHTITAFR